VRTARRLYEERELTVAEIGGVLGVSRTSIYRALHSDLAGVPGVGGGQRRRRTAALAAPVAPLSAGALPQRRTRARVDDHPPLSTAPQS